MPESSVVDRQVRCQKKGCKRGASEFLVIVNKDTDEEKSVFICSKHYKVIKQNAIEIIMKNRGK